MRYYIDNKGLQEFDKPAYKLFEELCPNYHDDYSKSLYQNYAYLGNLMDSDRFLFKHPDASPSYLAGLRSHDNTFSFYLSEAIEWVDKYKEILVVYAIVPDKWGFECKVKILDETKLTTMMRQYHIDNYLLENI